MRLTEETAIACFSVYRAWFGPPPAMYRGALVDGRVRVGVCEKLGLPAMRTNVLRSTDDALRWLIVAGHLARAFELAREESVPIDDLLHVRLGLPAFIVSPVLPVARKLTHRRRGPTVAETVAAARCVLQWAAEENRYIAPSELLEILG